jgi:hypothetical protein
MDDIIDYHFHWCIEVNWKYQICFVESVVSLYLSQQTVCLTKWWCLFWASYPLLLSQFSVKNAENLWYYVHAPRVALIGFISISNHHHPQQNDCQYQHNTIANNTNGSTRLYNAVDYNVN